jgi:hypothetical protein
MDIINSYRLWADGHVFYDSPLAGQTTAKKGPLTAREGAWQKRIVQETPNGELFQRNVLFDALTGSGTLTLLHITHGLERISQRGIIYPSGGCLVGSIYCCPLIPADDGFRMHNLGRYVLTKEAPAFVARLGRKGGTPTPLIIEITMPPDAYRGLAGIDYLRLGDIHLQIFRQLEYLLSKSERHNLREKIAGRIKNSAAFSICARPCSMRMSVWPLTSSCRCLRRRPPGCRSSGICTSRRCPST